MNRFLACRLACPPAAGLPGSGKSRWAAQHAAANPTRRYLTLSTDSVMQAMRVGGRQGSWGLPAVCAASSRRRGVSSTLDGRTWVVVGSRPA
jgi:hypothetical protein